MGEIFSKNRDSKTFENFSGFTGNLIFLEFWSGNPEILSVKNVSRIYFLECHSGDSWKKSSITPKIWTFYCQRQVRTLTTLCVCMCVCMWVPADRPGDINSLLGYPTRLGTMCWTRVCRFWAEKYSACGGSSEWWIMSVHWNVHSIGRNWGGLEYISPHGDLFYQTGMYVFVVRARKSCPRSFAAWLRLAVPGGPRKPTRWVVKSFVYG